MNYPPSRRLTLTDGLILIAAASPSLDALH